MYVESGSGYVEKIVGMSNGRVMSKGLGTKDVGNMNKVGRVYVQWG